VYGSVMGIPFFTPALPFGRHSHEIVKCPCWVMIVTSKGGRAAEICASHFSKTTQHEN
jgi:hypothetical protein